MSSKDLTRKNSPMGRVEKFTVLAVLLLIAIILVVSMTTDNAVDKSKAAVLGERPSVPVEAPSETPAVAQTEPGNKLLSANVGAQVPVANPAPAPAAPQPRSEEHTSELQSLT